MKTLNINNCSDGFYDRQTDRLTDRQTDRPGQRKATDLGRRISAGYLHPPDILRLESGFSVIHEIVKYTNDRIRNTQVTSYYNQSRILRCGSAL